MNELHDYPPEWDEQELAEHPEFEGLLTKNVEALFNEFDIDEKLMGFLGDYEPTELGCDLLMSLVILLKGVKPERIERDHYYAILISEKLTELREALTGAAIKYVHDDTEQELAEIIKNQKAEQQILEAGL